VGLALCIAENR